MNKGTESKKYRINLFQQMKLFFEIVEENPDFSQTEISLYFFLLNFNNLLAWREWFTLALSQALGGARLSEKTYYKAINKLENMKLIERRKGHKNQAGQIKIINLKTVNFTVGARIEGKWKESGREVNVPTSIDSKDSKDNKDYLYKRKTFFESEIKKGREELKRYQDEHPYSKKDNIPIEYQEPYKGRMKVGNQLREYIKYCGFLTGKNIIEKPLVGILSIPGQLPISQFVTLCGKYYAGKWMQNDNGSEISDNTPLPKALTDIILKINNVEKYYKGAKELFPILNTWMKNESHADTKNNQSGRPH